MMFGKKTENTLMVVLLALVVFILGYISFDIWLKIQNHEYDVL